MSSRRLNTVHDVASLRIQPSGARIRQALDGGDSNQAASGSSSTLKNSTILRNAKYTVRDAQGNFIANNAGGSAKIKRRRRKVKGKGKEKEKIPEVAEAIQEDESDDSEEDQRKVKRTKFKHDLSFLLPPELPTSEPLSSALPTQTTTGESDLPVPSSDLLKFIHFFASEYYSKHGRLSNIGKEARIEKQQRRNFRLRQLVQQKSGKAADEESEERNTGSEEDGEDELDSSDDEGSKGDASNDVVKGKRASRKKRLGGTKSYRDMYKALDGSALVALGMLVQEHIAQNLRREPPDGWEEEMEGQVEEVEDEQGRIRTGKKKKKKIILEDDPRLKSDALHGGDNGNQHDEGGAGSEDPNESDESSSSSTTTSSSSSNVSSSSDTVSSSESSSSSSDSDSGSSSDS